MMTRWYLFMFSRNIVRALLLVTLLVRPAGAQVVINEIYYDHPGQDGEYEFVELINTSDGPHQLDGLRIEFVDGRTAEARTVWNAPSGVVLEPGAVLLVAGEEYSVGAGFLLQGRIENGPDAVRLVSTQAVLDAVGYGALMHAGLAEGEPALDVDAGQSLARRPDGADTDRNRSDFVPSRPSPGHRNFFEFDVSLSWAAEDVLPCRGDAFDVRLVITNAGLGRFGDLIGVIVTARGVGGTSHPVREEVHLEMDPGATETMVVTLPPTFSERIELVAALESAVDQQGTNDTAATTVCASPADVILNEIMYRPAAGESEWVELLNRSGAPLNLRGWCLSDATGSRRVISWDDLWIAPGEYLVLAQYPERVSESGHTFRVAGTAGGWPRLNDSGPDPFIETVMMHDAEGVLVECVRYPPLAEEEYGRSIERFSEHCCAVLAGGIWHRCASPRRATPGVENSIRTPPGAADGAISIRPNPFVRGVDRAAVISGACRGGETGFLVRIFDIGGREIRRLIGEEGGARIFTCRWDGSGGNGAPVTNGLYICLIEFVREGGWVCRRERRSIAVGSR